MGTINVTIDAVSDGKKVEFSFNWEGDRQQIEETVSAIKRIAEQGGVTAQQFAQSTLIHFPRTGILQDEGAQQVQMMAIIFAILSEAEKRIDELPGPVLDVIADQDVSAVITVRDDNVTMQLSGEPGKDSAYATIN